MVKKIIALTLALALVLGQGLAYAATFTVDVRIGPITAKADLSGTPADERAELMVSLKDTLDNDVTEISWTGVNLGDDWKKAASYLLVNYYGNKRKWGIQVFTDNMGTIMTANPQYDGDPTQYIDQQPDGLIGVARPRLTCPVVMLTTANKITDPLNSATLEVPVEVEKGTKGKPDYVVYFENGYDEKAEPLGKPVIYEKVWYWLKDLSSTKWVDDGDDQLEPGELQPNFSHPTGYGGGSEDDYATIVNSMGIASGWVDLISDEMIRDFELGSEDGNQRYTMYVYLAAKFKKARELQEYKTGTLTLELYHEAP